MIFFSVLLFRTGTEKYCRKLIFCGKVPLLSIVFIILETNEIFKKN